MEQVPAAWRTRLWMPGRVPEPLAQPGASSQPEQSTQAGVGQQGVASQSCAAAGRSAVVRG